MTFLLAAALVPVALRRVSWILGVLVWRCRARLPHVLVSLLKFLMTARLLIESSLLVKEPSFGK